MVSTFVRPFVWKSDAATMSIAMFARPASPIAIVTSTRWKRSRRRFSSVVVVTIRRWVNAECR